MYSQSKKVLSIATIGLAVTVVLAGCGTGGSPNSSNSNASGSNNVDSSSSNKPVTLTLSWWTNPTRTKMTQQAVQLFEKKYPNIHVTMEYDPWSGYWSKMATEAAAGSAPDVMQMDASYLNQYVSQGQLLDLSKTSVDTSGINPSTVSLGEVNDKLYALPVGINTECNIYNPAILKQAGITYDTSKSYTWDQFSNLLIEIHKKLPNVYGSTNGNADIVQLQYWARSHGQKLYSTDGKSIVLSKSVLTDWFSYWLNLQNKGGVLPAQVSASWNGTDISTSPFNQGKVSFTTMWIGEGTEYEKDLGKPIQRVLLPEWGNSNKPYMLHPSMYWAISSKTKNPGAAAKLVDFLENDSQVSKIFQNDRGVPSNVKNMQADAKVSGGVIQIQDDFMNKVQPLASKVALDPPNAGQLTNVLQTIAQEVDFSKLTPSQAASQFIQQGDSVLAQSN